MHQMVEHIDKYEIYKIWLGECFSEEMFLYICILLQGLLQLLFHMGEVSVHHHFPRLLMHIRQTLAVHGEKGGIPLRTLLDGKEHALHRQGKAKGRGALLCIVEDFMPNRFNGRYDQVPFGGEVLVYRTH